MRHPAVEEDFIEVALVDDHALLRQALRKAFHYHGKIKIGIEASDYSELLEKLYTARLGIIIMDLFMPDLDMTKSTIRQIQQLIPQAKILILTMHNDEYIRQELIKYGIFSFIFKGADFEQLIESIVLAAEAGLADSGFEQFQITRNDHKRRTNGRDVKCVTFSDREKMILKLIAEGKTNSEISRVVFLSVRSIEQIRHDMKDRANVIDTASLIDFAVRNRMIE